MVLLQTSTTPARRPSVMGLCNWILPLLVMTSTIVFSGIAACPVNVPEPNLARGCQCETAKPHVGRVWVAQSYRRIYTRQFRRVSEHADGISVSFHFMVLCW